MKPTSNDVKAQHLMPVVARKSIRLLAITLAMVAGPAAAHKLTVDKNGCHQETKSGQFHCHEGPLKGRSFADRRAMNAALVAARLGQKKPEKEGKPGKN
ncbi:MAG: hypothetical protein AAF358_23985 [Pseudomonadota bacterium]